MLWEFFLKLRGLKTNIDFFNKQSPLNENDGNFDGKPNDINYKITVTKLHDAGWIFFNSSNIYIIGYGCGVSHYPQFYNQDIYKYQVLSCPYLGSFENYPEEKFIK